MPRAICEDCGSLVEAELTYNGICTVGHYVHCGWGHQLSPDDLISDDAAQIIAELEAKLALMTTERDEAWKRAAHAEKMWGEAEVKLAECEARLGKAVEAGQTMDDGCDCERCSKARATLAEIKLQSSEFATQKGESYDPL